MITETDIDREELRIAEAISLKYHNDEISASDLGERLKYLRAYSGLLKRSLECMQSLEMRL